MAPTKQQILDSLAKVPSPDGTPITATGALSDVVVTDGKVFFSISVDAGAVQAWEPVRKRAEEAVRAVPGVQSALVALTAERKTLAAAAARPSPAAAVGPRAARARSHRGGARRRGDHRGRLRQGRRRQIHDRGQSGARACRARPQGRHPRRRYLRPVAAKTARDQGEAADHRRHAAQADRALRPHGDVDRLPDRGRDAG